MQHQQVDENTFVCFILPQTSNVQRSKNLFWAICQQTGMRCIEKDVLFLVAERTVPFETYITLNLIPHPTKGYLGVLQSKPINKLQAFGCSMLPGWLSCSLEPTNCTEWYNCPKHYSICLHKFIKQFIERYLTEAENQNISHVPEDTMPICLGATCLPINSTHTTSVGFNEKTTYYTDIRENDLRQQIVVQVKSPKRIQMLIRYKEQPNVLQSDVFSVSVKQQDSTYLAEFLLNSTSTPELCSGRWFFVIRGSSLLSKSNTTISLTAIDYVNQENDNNYRLSVSQYMPDNDEDAWIFVADDSSAAGRKLKPELVGSFSASSSKIQDCPPGDVEQLAAFSFDPHGDEEEENQVPDSFLCPITRSIMEKPVVAADGFSYEYDAICKWLEDHIRSPMTGDSMQHKMLIANHNLKSQIDAWRSK